MFGVIEVESLIPVPLLLVVVSSEVSSGVPLSSTTSKLSSKFTLIILEGATPLISLIEIESIVILSPGDGVAGDSGVNRLSPHRSSASLFTLK